MTTIETKKLPEQQLKKLDESTWQTATIGLASLGLVGLLTACNQPSTGPVIIDTHKIDLGKVEFIRTTNDFLSQIRLTLDKPGLYNVSVYAVGPGSTNLTGKREESWLGQVQQSPVVQVFSVESSHFPGLTHANFGAAPKLASVHINCASIATFSLNNLYVKEREGTFDGIKNNFIKNSSIVTTNGSF
jgi:hypothetical protein